MRATLGTLAIIWRATRWPCFGVGRKAFQLTGQESSLAESKGATLADDALTLDQNMIELASAKTSREIWKRYGQMAMTGNNVGEKEEMQSYMLDGH